MIVGHIGGSSSGGYEIQKSLRFRASASAYLSRTPTVAGNQRTHTLSAWFKRGVLGNVPMQMFCTQQTSSFQHGLAFDFDTLRFLCLDVSTFNIDIKTTAVFRDPSAWYHVVVSVDTTDATASNRVKLFVNGVQITSLSTATYPAQNYVTRINGTTVHNIARNPAPSEYFDGYLSEINFIDGQALDPSYFGQVSTETGSWIPKKYTGTYGTNGFYLPFNDGSTLGNLAADRSGNGNNWTANNISLTSGSSYDWMDDTPTNNFAVLNPLYVRGTAAVLSSANLSFQTQGSSQCETSGSHALPDSGKFYWEYVVTSMPTSRSMVGVGLPYVGTGIFTDSTNGCGYYSLDGKCYIGNVAQFTGATYTVNDVIGIAVDRDAGIVAFYKNNSLQGTASFNVSGVLPMLCDTDTTAGIHVGGYINFGQRPFAYSPPAGFKALCTKNLPTPSILNPKKHFDVVKRTGTGANRTITGVGFNPALVWIKPRNVVDHHILTDYIRGTQKQLYSNLTLAEETETTGNLIGFTSDGYTLAGAAASVRGATNVLNDNYVDWLWKAGGAPVTNNAGSIQSQVSANPQAGFSIVTYTGTGANATVGHGLGVAPKMVIVKKRNAGSSDWRCYHVGLDASAPNNYFIDLNATASRVNAVAAWNNSGPSSSTFSLGTNVNTNGSADTFVAYCFAEVPGFSKIGSYTGNGSADGPFVYCGFRPKFVMIKRTDAASNWIIKDSARSLYNVGLETLYPNLANAEGAGESWDATANGIKLRSTSTEFNANGGTYIFIAIAEQPFQFANAR